MRLQNALHLISQMGKIFPYANFTNSHQKLFISCAEKKFFARRRRVLRGDVLTLYEGDFEEIRRGGVRVWPIYIEYFGISII